MKTLIVNIGQIVSGDVARPLLDGDAIAIDGGLITAVGRGLDGDADTIIDAAGTTVIPGLIDSHLHAIRAALSFSTEVNWIGAPSLVDALARIREASRTMKPGAWLIVAGGWNVQQFKENRRPTQAELVAAAPNNPVYVQLGYGWAMLTPAAARASMPFWAVASSAAVMVTVLAFWLQTPLTPSTPFNAEPTALTQPGQQR